MVPDKTWSFGGFFKSPSLSMSKQVLKSEVKSKQIASKLPSTVSYWKYSIMESKSKRNQWCYWMQIYSKHMQNYELPSIGFSSLYSTSAHVRRLEDSVKWGFYFIYFALILHFWGALAPDTLKINLLHRWKKKRKKLEREEKTTCISQIPFGIPILHYEGACQAASGRLPPLPQPADALLIHHLHRQRQLKLKYWLAASYRQPTALVQHCSKSFRASSAHKTLQHQAKTLKS